MRYRALLSLDFDGRFYERGEYVPLPEPLSASHRRFVAVGVVAAEPDEEPAAPADPDPDPEA